MENMIIIFKIAASITLLSASPTLHAGAIRIGGTLVQRTAKDSSVRGKNVEGLSLPFAAASAPHPSTHPITRAYRVSCSAAVPHKFEHDACLAYSAALPRYLKSAGARNVHRLIYRWTDFLGSGRHSVVAYTDASGNWIADNEQSAPKYTPGRSMQKRVETFEKSFDGPATVQLEMDMPLGL